MLVCIPNAPYGRLGALLSALIVCCCMIGLTMHRDFYAGVPRRGFWVYYTHVSNLVVLLYFALGAPLLYGHAALAPLIAHIEYGVTMCILLTHVVFHLMLMPSLRKAANRAEHTRAWAIACANNVFVHYLVPWLTALYWLLCSPGKATLRWWDAPLCALLPLGYLLVEQISAPHRTNLPQTDSPYPYPFLDCRARGARAVAQSCVGLCALYLLCAGLVVVAVRWSFARWGGGHAFILI